MAELRQKTDETGDIAMDKSKKEFMLMLLSIVLTVVCLVVTVILNRKVADQTFDEGEVQTVKCKITSVAKKSVRINGHITSSYEVYGMYDGVEQEIRNVSSSGYSYREGSTREVYLYKGKLYGNIEGIKTTTAVGVIYFVFLFGTFGMFILMTCAITKYFQGRKELHG